jgi:hypothetical protein
MAGATGACGHGDGNAGGDAACAKPRTDSKRGGTLLSRLRQAAKALGSAPDDPQQFTAEDFKQHSPCLGHDGRGGSHQQFSDGGTYGRSGPSPAPVRAAFGLLRIVSRNRVAGSEISLKFAEIQWSETLRAGDGAGKFC